jgi:periplasmic divalent cation tolerance protein
VKGVLSGASGTLAVVTTVAERDDARRLAQALVERGLAACAQISEIESFYRWDGRLQQERELRIVFKTTAERYAEVEAAIREMHPYQLPAIHAVALDHVYEPYAAWIATHSGSVPR